MMYYVSGMILIKYVDYTLFFRPKLNDIEQAITEIEALGCFPARWYA